MKSFFEQQLDLLLQKKISKQEFLNLLRDYPYLNSQEIKLDFSRNLMRGIPEVIYGEGKTADQLITIINLLKKKDE